MQHTFLLSVSGFIHDNHALFFALLIGGIAGLIAQLIVPGRGFGIIVTILLGMVGGWLGSMLFKNYLSFTHNKIIDHIICATVGAMILCIIINLIAGGETKNRSAYRS